MLVPAIFMHAQFGMDMIWIKPIASGPEIGTGDERNASRPLLGACQ